MDKNVFDLTLDAVVSDYSFTYPCENHGSDILSYAVYYYVRLRMRQFCFQQNQKQLKKSSDKRKFSKLENM